MTARSTIRRLVTSVLFLAASSTMSWAGSVVGQQLPAPLQKIVDVFNNRGGTLENGAFRIIMDRVTVNHEIFYAAIEATCGAIWLDPKRGWGNAKVDRIEVVNRTQGQGFAIVNARKSCDEFGVFKGDTEKLIVSKAWVCVAGFPCRARRSGEITAGDE